MVDWIAQNPDRLQVVVSLLTMLVWLAYLHIFWLNFRRQRQAVILITRSVAQDENAHCSFIDLLRRADVRIGSEGIFDEVQEMELTVAAIDGHASHLVAARCKFRADWKDGKLYFLPERVMTHQIRSIFQRRKINAMLEEQIE